MCVGGRGGGVGQESTQLAFPVLNTHQLGPGVGTSSCQRAPPAPPPLRLPLFPPGAVQRLLPVLPTQRGRSKPLAANNTTEEENRKWNWDHKSTLLKALTSASGRSCRSRTVQRLPLTLNSTTLQAGGGVGVGGGGFNALIFEDLITTWVWGQNPGGEARVQQRRHGKRLRWLSVTANLHLIKHSNHFTIDGFEGKTPNFGSRTPSFETWIANASCSTDSHGTVVSSGSC